MNSYQFVMQKISNDQMGYSAQPALSLGPRVGAPGAPAMPPPPAVKPTSFAPMPSPPVKVGSMIEDIENAVRKKRLLQHAKDMGSDNLSGLKSNYQGARNTALKGLGLRGLGLGLGGLALYKGIKHYRNTPSKEGG